MARYVARVSFTEIAHFRRLVRFLADIEEYAEESRDVALQSLVEEVREDLLHMDDDA